MITALVIILLFGGGLGGKNLDLTDPVVLAEFQQNVSQIVPDPNRARNVTGAIYQLNVMAQQNRSSDGLVAKEIGDMRAVLGNYNATRDESMAALRELSLALDQVNQQTVAGREVIRQNTTKKEWKKLLKELSK